MSRIVIASALLGTVLTNAQNGAAGPLAQSGIAMANAIKQSSVLDMIHGCHRVCRRGPVGVGHWSPWHRHVGPRCRIVTGCNPK